MRSLSLSPLRSARVLLFVDPQEKAPGIRREGVVRVHAPGGNPTDVVDTTEPVRAGDSCGVRVIERSEDSQGARILAHSFVDVEREGVVMGEQDRAIASKRETVR